MNQSLISRDKRYLGGLPRIRSQKLSVRLIKQWHKAGWSVENICDLYDITQPQVKAAINYGKRKKIKF